MQRRARICYWGSWETQPRIMKAAVQACCLVIKMEESKGFILENEREVAGRDPRWSSVSARPRSLKPCPTRIQPFKRCMHAA